MTRLRYITAKLCARKIHTEIESTEFHEKSGKSPSNIYTCTDDMRFFAKARQLELINFHVILPNLNKL